MGKILNALKTANGETSDLVLRCLDEQAFDGPVGVADARERRSTRAAVETIFERPAVVRLPQHEEHPGRRSVSFRISDSSPLLSSRNEDRRAAEQYRIIRTKIFHQVQGASVTAISSPGMGDGKTITALNLAAALAMKSEDRVILVDADLRLSKVHERLGIARTPGLAEVLAGRCTLEEAVLHVEQLPNFQILTAGDAASNPTELLDSSNWRALIARLRGEFQRTIVDCPPVEVVADYDLIAGSCDGLVLVVRPDYTSRPLLTSALAKVKGKLTGVLINGAEDWFLWKRSSASYSYYQGGPVGKKGSKPAK